MPSTHIIGDIHGCCKTFRQLVEEHIRPTTADQIICVGDYIDRGPDSKGVIDYIMEMRQRGLTVRTLRGNHEQMLLDGLMDSTAEVDWLLNGGEATLMSFGIISPLQLPDEYISFLEETPLYHMTDHWIIVHAGLNCRIEDPFADTYSMLWTRDIHIDLERTGGRRVIHGHTPFTLEEIEASRQSLSINIDGGCFRKGHPGMGHLVAIDLDSLDLIIVRNCE